MCLGKPISNGLPQEKSAFGTNSSFGGGFTSQTASSSPFGGSPLQQQPPFQQTSTTQQQLMQEQNQPSGNSEWAAWGSSPSPAQAAPAPAVNDLFGSNDFAFNTPASQPAFNAPVSNPSTFGSWNNQPAGRNLKNFLASFNFEARNNDELSFVEGDILEIDLDAEVEPEWYYGTCNGRGGLFPQAYVTPYEEPASSVVVTSSAFTLQPATSPSIATSPTENVLETVSAVYPFNGVEAKHMSFAAGSTIDVIEKQEEWWRGRLKDGTSGWFPKSYVQSARLVVKKEAKRAAPKPPGGTAPIPSPAAPVVTGVPFTAAYDFHGQETTDLSFASGDTVLVTKQEGEWWEGQTEDGRVGIFPASFVEPIEVEEELVSYLTRIAARFSSGPSL